MRSDVVAMPDGEGVRFWTFEDPQAIAMRSSALERVISPPIRLTEGCRGSITLRTALPVRRASRHAARGRAAATAVWMEAEESYTYHWAPPKSGTWFYQCHTSNARQFEMGLYGVIVVDTPADAEGRRRVYHGGPAYDVERFWVLDDVDPQWHSDAFDGKAIEADGRLREFAPKYFLVNGVPNTEAARHSEVVVEARLGETLLLRLMNASFSLLKVTFDKLAGDIVAVDGNVLGTEQRPWTRWIRVAAGQPLHLATASRYDLLLDLDPASGQCPGPGEYAVTFEFHNGKTRKIHNCDAPHPANVGRATTVIRVL